MKDNVKKLFNNQKLYALINIVVVSIAFSYHFFVLHKIGDLFPENIMIKFDLRFIHISEMPWNNLNITLSNNLIYVLIFIVLNLFILHRDKSSNFILSTIALVVINNGTREVLKTVMIYLNQSHNVNKALGGSVFDYYYYSSSIIIDTQKGTYHFINYTYIFITLLIISNIVFYFMSKRKPLNNEYVIEK